ncbi:MAG TPA: ABC transporter permease subunit, partial [Clostridiales bacterium]|nr:ABC transporter permease subunit [Clostridiales bacterium]
MDNLQKIISWMPSLLSATKVTLLLSVLSTLTALALAVFLALGKISRHKIISKPVGAYIFFFRGTPLLMQLFFIYYTLPQLFPVFTIKSRFFAAWLAFSLNIAAYLAEIIRAAIQ